MIVLAAIDPPCGWCQDPTAIAALVAVMLAVIGASWWLDR